MCVCACVNISASVCVCEDLCSNISSYRMHVIDVGTDRDGKRVAPSRTAEAPPLLAESKFDISRLAEIGAF